MGPPRKMTLLVLRRASTLFTSSASSRCSLSTIQRCFSKLWLKAGGRVHGIASPCTFMGV